MKNLKEIILEENGGTTLDSFVEYIDNRIRDIASIDEKQDEELKNIGCLFRKDKFIYKINLQPFIKEGYKLKDLFSGTVFENICVQAFKTEMSTVYDHLNNRAEQELNKMNHIYYYNGWEFALFPALCEIIATYNPKGFLGIYPSQEDKNKFCLEIKNEYFINTIADVTGIDEIEKVLSNSLEYTGYQNGQFVLLNLGECIISEKGLFDNLKTESKSITLNCDMTIKAPFLIIKK